MMKKIAIFIVSFLTWMLLNWHTDVSHLLTGVLASAFVTYIIGDLPAGNSGLYKDPRRLLRLLFVYLPMFFFSMLKAAVSVAYRILHPDLPIRPGIVKVKTTLKTDVALTLLANTMTLTSGTMTVDVDRENGILYVHCVYVKADDPEFSARLVVERFEPVIRKIFE